MIKLNNLVATYTTERGQVNAVDGINIALPSGKIIGIAGESGCGKSTLLKVIYGDLIYPLALTSGNVEYGFTGDRGTEVTTRDIKEYWFRRISYIPQASMSSLNPVIRIRRQFVDFQGNGVDEAKILAEVREYVRSLDLPAEAIDAYPHQLSGGMRQRIMVAMGTFFKPDIILADEPTTALDVVVQKSILMLLMDIQEQMENTILFVSHDMGVHYQLTHKMLIMYAAKVVEFGDSEDVFSTSLHPYTKMLTDSLPTIGDDHIREGVSGRPPSLWDELVGCRFAARCPLATEICRQQEPALLEHKPGHFSACHHADQV
ncbi:MAG: ABC transporter ATP-binding protein [Anaerolineae bacterium]|nr:ABC transporter ATP-binding protein [Anaerolineae bacterium]MCA9892907.1 ABC transporter ATP-binding protein [Anaerolineae bacterium]